jgi:hypothetical protein
MPKTPKGRVHFSEAGPAPGDASSCQPSEVSNPLFMNEAFADLPDASAEAVILKIDSAAPATPSAVRKDAAAGESAGLPLSDASGSDDNRDGGEGADAHGETPGMSPHEVAMLKYSTSARRLPRTADCYVEPQGGPAGQPGASPWVSSEFRAVAFGFGQGRLEGDEGRVHGLP